MNRADLLSLLAAVVIAIAVALLVTQVVMGPEFAAYVNESARWCAERGGVMWNAQAMVHGGLHCELPNGSVVHMSEVVEPPQAA